jgi:hypothetical protein
MHIAILLEKVKQFGGEGADLHPWGNKFHK